MSITLELALTSYFLIGAWLSGHSWGWETYATKPDRYSVLVATGYLIAWPLMLALLGFLLVRDRRRSKRRHNTP